MKQNTTKKPGVLCFGWKIRIHIPGKPSQDMPVIYAPLKPCLWESLQQDSGVTAMTLFRSGRKVDTFQRAGGQV